MQFKDVIGQQNLKQSLVHLVDSSRVSHAQLFVGDVGYGGLPLAIALAQYLNCTSRSGGDSCGVCASCVQTASLAHPDVHFVFPVASSDKVAQKGGEVDMKKPVSDHFIKHWRQIIASTGGYFSEQMWYNKIEIDNKQGNIGVNEASEIIRKLSFKAFESQYKVVIIWLPERMNEPAANKLLKILEEPSEKTIFLMVSDSPELLLPTIISRTQEVNLRQIPIAELSQYLARRELAQGAQAEEIARLAHGNAIEAERIATHQTTGDPNFDRFVNLMRLSYDDKHLQLMEWAEEVATLGREGQKLMLENFIRLFRESYMMSMGVEKVSYLYGPEHSFCKRFAPYINNSNIEPLVAETELLIRQIAQNANPKIAFTHYVLFVSKLIIRL